MKNDIEIRVCRTTSTEKNSGGIIEYFYSIEEALEYLKRLQNEVLSDSN